MRNLARWVKVWKPKTRSRRLSSEERRDTSRRSWNPLGIKLDRDLEFSNLVTGREFFALGDVIK